MSNPTPSHATLAESAASLDRFLINAIDQLARDIALARQDIARIERLTTISETTERAKELAPSKADLSAASTKFDHIKQASRYGVLGSPVVSTMAWLDVRTARKALQEAEQELDDPAERIRRATYIDEHNKGVAAERARLACLQSSYATYVQLHEDLTQFSAETREAVAAAETDGWTAGDFAAHSQQMVSYALAGNMLGARQHLAWLVFQRKPSDATYAHWCGEAHEIRKTAYASYIGMPASGAYAEVAVPSMELGCRSLHSSDADTVNSYTHPADRWQAFSAVLTDPRHYKVDALWSIYWAMFQAGQWVADLTSKTDPHEDIVTGKLSAQIDRRLSDWAVTRMKRFGYPTTTSYFGTLEIAAKGEETRLGADIGLIVDLQIGDLTARKVVLFQAKKAKRGMADLGSTSRQLSKLAASPSKGFYLFYHHSDFAVRAPAPTVCEAQALAKVVKGSGKSLDARHLLVSVRTHGWDWASFVAFGLCDANSTLGESFTTPYDALSKLGGGDPRHLPSYLYIIAITDESRVLDLEKQIRAYYRDPEHEHHQSHRLSRDHNQERDGPELSL